MSSRSTSERSSRPGPAQRLTAVVLWTAAAAAPLFGQASLTGAVAGTARGPNGDPLPGVTVTAVSEALQGSRTATTAATGDFLLRNLPSGRYRLSFVLEGMSTLEQSVEVELGRTTRADAELELSEIEETIEVVSDAPTAVSNTEIGTNLTAREVDELPIDREPISIANFSPGVSDRSAVEGQISISGGIGYDNLIMLDGVDAGFFIFGNGSGPAVFPSEVGLFIEDSIEETQVLTGTISAEYGRFSGGVVNAVTRRGGNQFKGSVRVDMTNPSWREESPIEERLGFSNESNRNDLFSTTLGGYLLKDRLWFFVAGSDTSRSEPGLFPVSNLPRPDEFDNRRYEIKLTGNIGDRHTIEALTLQNSSDFVQSIFGIDPRTINETSLDHEYAALRYSGVLGSSLLLEGRYSDREVENKGFGGTSTDLRDSPIIALSFPGTAIYNAPVFDQNDQSFRFEDETFAAVLSTFLSSESAGSHDLRFGLERFASTQFGGNSQASTGFIWLADYLTDIEGQPFFDEQGRFQPVFVPFGALALNFIADRNAVLETTTSSLFVNDVWRLNDHWSFNLGFRYEQVEGDATPSVEVADFDSIVPRLAATYSPGASGKYRITAGYGEYVGRANSELFKRTSSSRNANNVGFDYLYVGPPGAGVDFAPGFDLDNYVIIGASSTENSSFESGLSTPRSVEVSLSFAMQLARGGYFQAALIDRSFEDAFESFIEIGNGTTLIDSRDGPFPADNIVYRNTDLAERDYLALQLQGRYRLTPDWTIDGHWTWELENDGNFLGEDPGNPAEPSVIGTYPELRVPERNYPTGSLPSHLEHKIRLWTNYHLGFGAAGDLDLSLLFRYDSPLTYSHVANVPLSAQQLARDPGYTTPPFFQDVFFGGRGGQEFEELHAFDLAAIYQVAVWKSVEPWIKLQVRNIFDSTPKLTFDTTIFPDLTGPVDGNGIPTAFVRGPSYGDALSADDFYPGREFLVSLGVRF